jgi:hypothetical protein
MSGHIWLFAGFKTLFRPKKCWTLEFVSFSACDIFVPCLKWHVTIRRSLDWMIGFISFIHSIFHGTEPISRSRQLCSYSRNSQHFPEPKSSLPRSQEPSTSPYTESDYSSPYHPILSLRSILIESAHLNLGVPSGLFPSCYMHSSPPLFVLHALPIISTLTWSF